MKIAKKCAAIVAYAAIGLFVAWIGLACTAAPGAAGGVTYTKGAATDRFVCIERDIIGLGNFDDETVLTDNVTFTPLPTIVNVAQNPTMNGRIVRLYFDFPAGGAGTSHVVRAQNGVREITFNATATADRWVATIPFGEGQSATLDTVLASPPQIVVATEPGMGQVLRITNPGTASLRISILQVSSTSTRVPTSNLDYDNPSVNALPWTTAISSDLDFSPGQTRIVDVPDSPVAYSQNSYVRMRYRSVSLGDPLTSAVLLVPVPQLIPALPAVFLAVLVGVLGILLAIGIRTRG